MKLLRYGPKGQEKPGLLDEEGRIRDLSDKINDIDGVRVTTPDGWWLLRPSNTQSVLVARAEAKTEAGLKKLTDMACSHVAKIGYTLDFTKP